MTVGELREKLQQLPADSVVGFADGEYGFIEITSIDFGTHQDGLTREFVKNSVELGV